MAGPVNEPFSSEEEESEDDEGSESQSSDEESKKENNDFSGETRLDEDEDLTRSKSKIDSKSVNQETGSDLLSPSSNISRVSKSTPKRTHDDEITLLNRIIDFKNNVDIVSYHNLFEGKFHFNFSKVQLSSKIKRLKNRFLNALKNSKNGKVPVFSNKVFQLSNEIWGDSIGIKCENGRIYEKERLKVEKFEWDEKEIVKIFELSFFSEK
ncbi:hypothetical protein CASFOL_031373 [Castilleja foliolosa]|uniref:Glabrous enhancer-binding protein-like DBD domain-containing protein n=1 Tax=Castilleja foliolosa TaxID=1961234 RepID=A0ABD3C4I6_9LAMI